MKIREISKKYNIQNFMHFGVTVCILGVIYAISGHLFSVYAQDSVQTSNLSTVKMRGRTSAPPVSTTGNAIYYFDNVSGKLKVSQNGGAYVNMVGGGGGGSSPGGANGTAQYNIDGTNFGAITSLTTNGTIVTQLSGSDYVLADPASPTKKATFDLSHITAGQTRTVNVPDANSTTVQAVTLAAHNFATSVSAQGVVGGAQPACGDLSNAGGGCTMSTTAGGDLSGTLPSPTVAKVQGISFSATGPAHSIPVVTTANTATLYKTIPDCQDSAGNHLNYTQSTDLFSCGTSSSGGGGGSPAGSTNDIQVNSAGSFGADTGALTWNLSTHLGLMKTSDSGTTNTPNTLEFYHATSGTAAAGFGSGFLMTGDTNGGTRRALGAIYSVEDTATDGSRSSHVSIQAVDTAAAAADVARFGFVHNGGFPVAQVIAQGSTGQPGIPQFTSAQDTTTGIRMTTAIFFQNSGVDRADLSGGVFESDAWAVNFNNGDVAFRRESSTSAKISNRAGSSYLDLKLRNLNSAAGVIVLANYVVSGLPSASTSGPGAMAYVTDSSLTAITGLGLAVTGGGSNKVVVVSDGTNWIVQ